MPKNERTRIEIAFDGGQIVGALVTAKAADELQKALGAETSSAHELETEDGVYILPLPRIVYVKRFSRETSIGFGGSR